MKTFTFGWAALVAAGLVQTAVAGDAQPLALGAKAPLATTKMKSATDGKEFSIADAAGKLGTLVVFTCNGCPYARAWESRIVDLGHEYSGKGIGVLLVNANDPGISSGDAYDKMQARARERALKVPYVVDAGSQVARAFGATVTPEAFLFDKRGQLVYHGTIDDNHRDPSQVEKRWLKDALDAVIAGKPVKTAESKSLGCGIKYPRNS